MYNVRYSKKAIKQLLKLNTIARKNIYKWIEKNLIGCLGPYKVPNFKELKGDKLDYIRYRIGNYRIICFISDKELIIEGVQVGYRKEIYK